MKIGVLGAGQLGRMLGLAGVPLGMEFRFFDPADDPPAGAVGEHVHAGYADDDALDRFASGLDLVTYEFENVPAAAVERVARAVPVFPPVGALRTAQDRLLEKRFFRSLGIPTPEFAPIDSREDVAPALAAVGVPAVVKTRRFGYDGKGQRVAENAAAVEELLAETGGAPLIAEAFVPFEREVSMIGARGRDGRVALHPPFENRHERGILRESRFPAHLPEPVAATLRDHMTRALEALDYVGVLAIEFFVLDPSADAEGRPRVLANEMAPRVHNSGHGTIEGTETSQFENHLRAVAGLPLGSTEARGWNAMLNLIGDAPPTEAMLSVPGAHVHLYGKAPRPGRKIGHVTVRSDDREALLEAVALLRPMIGAASRG